MKKMSLALLLMCGVSTVYGRIGMHYDLQNDVEEYFLSASAKSLSTDPKGAEHYLAFLQRIENHLPAQQPQGQGFQQPPQQVPPAQPHHGAAAALPVPAEGLPYAEEPWKKNLNEAIAHEQRRIETEGQMPRNLNFLLDGNTITFENFIKDDLDFISNHLDSLPDSIKFLDATDKDLKRLLANQDIYIGATLDLSEQNITPAMVKIINWRLTRGDFKKVDLSHTHLTNETFNQLLPGLKHIKFATNDRHQIKSIEVDLSHNNLSSPSAGTVIDLAETLKTHLIDGEQQSIVINLSGNQLGWGGFTNIHHGIKRLGLAGIGTKLHVFLSNNGNFDLMPEDYLKGFMLNSAIVIDDQEAINSRLGWLKHFRQWHNDAAGKEIRLSDEHSPTGQKIGQQLNFVGSFRNLDDYHNFIDHVVLYAPNDITKVAATNNQILNKINIFFNFHKRQGIETDVPGGKMLAWRMPYHDAEDLSQLGTYESKMLLRASKQLGRNPNGHIIHVGNWKILNPDAANNMADMIISFKADQYQDASTLQLDDVRGTPDVLQPMLSKLFKDEGIHKIKELQINGCNGMNVQALKDLITNLPLFHDLESLWIDMKEEIDDATFNDLSSALEAHPKLKDLTFNLIFRIPSNEDWQRNRQDADKQATKVLMQRTDIDNIKKAKRGEAAAH